MEANNQDSHLKRSTGRRGRRKRREEGEEEEVGEGKQGEEGREGEWKKRKTPHITALSTNIY